MSEWGTTPAERLSAYAQRWERIAAERGTRMDELQARAEAAEAWCARLQQALAHALDCKGSFNGTVSERGGYPAICTDCEAEAREALAGQPAAAEEGA